jgi:hypothetical protein
MKTMAKVTVLAGMAFAAFVPQAVAHGLEAAATCGKMTITTPSSPWPTTKTIKWGLENKAYIGPLSSVITIPTSDPVNTTYTWNVYPPLVDEVETKNDESWYSINLELEEEGPNGELAKGEIPQLTVFDCTRPSTEEGTTPPREGPQPPRCVVPNFTKQTTLPTVEKSIRANHCNVGRIVRVHSRTTRRGRVVRLSPSPGSHLSRNAPVSIVVSLG